MEVISQAFLSVHVSPGSLSSAPWCVCHFLVSQGRCGELLSTLFWLLFPGYLITFLVCLLLIPSGVTTLDVVELQIFSVCFYLSPPLFPSVVFFINRVNTLSRQTSNMFLEKYYQGWHPMLIAVYLLYNENFKNVILVCVLPLPWLLDKLYKLCKSTMFNGQSLEFLVLLL